MPKPSTAISGTSAEKQEETIFLGIEKFELQKTILTKVVKGALPDNVKLQKDVISAVSKSASVFINYLAATSHESAVARNVKTISASDVLKGVNNADFYPHELLSLLQNELEAYRADGDEPPVKQRRKSSVSESEAPKPKGGRKAAEPAKRGPVIKLTVNGRNGKGKAREELVGALAAEADDDDLTEEDEDEDEDEEDEEEDAGEDEEEDEESLPGATGVEEGDAAMEEDSDGE